MGNEKMEKISISGYGRGDFSLRGLTEKEVEIMLGVVGGHAWATVVNGRLKAHGAREPLPSPIEDSEMLPYWGRPLPEQKPTQMELFNPKFSKPANGWGWGIVISHLCGYYYTPENYAKQAKLLESYGFQCLRSRRGKDGKFWEQWLLPSAWSAEGELKIYLDEVNGDDKEKMEKAIAFLCKHASFGSLDILIQRAAMTVD